MRSARLLLALSVITVTGIAGCSADLTDPFAPMALELTLSPAAETIYVSDTIQSANVAQLNLSATSLGLGVQTPSGVEWTSSNPSVAVVDSVGRVVPVSLGTTTVTARVNNTRARATVVVAFRTASRIVLKPSVLVGFAGDSALITATAVDPEGDIIPGTAYTFTSQDPTTAVVTATGTGTARILFLKPGVVNITVRAGGRTATVTASIYDPVIE